MAKRLPVDRRAPAALLALLLTPLAHAEWKFTPAVSATETFSDNVALQPSENAHSSFITDLSPSIAVASNGPRLKLVGGLQGHAFIYTNKRPGTYDTALSYQLSMHSTLIDDLLTLDANAMRGQNAVSAFGPQAGDSLYASGNRSNVSSYSVSPMLQHSFGGTANTYLRYSRNRVSSDNSFLGTSTGNNVMAGINSGSNFRVIGWGLTASEDEFSDARSGGTRHQSLLGNLSYRVSPAMSLTADSGYERYSYTARGSQTEGRNWSAGFVWTPSSRTRLQLSAGDHFYGKTVTMALAYRAHRSSVTASYGDTITTTRENFLRQGTPGTVELLDNLFKATIPDPVQRAEAIQAYIAATGIKPVLGTNVNFFSDRFLRQKQFVLGYALESAHATTVLSLSKTRTSPLSDEIDPNAGAQLPLGIDSNVDQTGAQATYNLRLTGSTEAYGSLTVQHSKSLTLHVSSDSETLRLGGTHRFSKTLRAAAEVRHARGGFDTLGGRRYHENAITAMIMQQF